MTIKCKKMITDMNEMINKYIYIIYPKNKHYKI